MSKDNEQQSGEITFLLPDISGFTKFLKETEISHSRHIIEELIAVIIRETKNHFRIAEVEGDALFLYQQADKTDTSAVFEVAGRTYTAFHRHLVNYEKLRICNCGACTTAVKLSLKFIAHTGSVEFAKVNGKNKPYGLESIKAHRLMKNNIEGRDYLLFSENFMDRYPVDNLKDQLVRGSATYDEIGEISYAYVRLIHLKESIQPDDHPQYLADNSLKVIASQTIEINAPVEIVYEVLSDLKYRSVWNTGARIVDHNEKDIYRIGSEHYCIIDNNKFRVRTIGNSESKREFGEQLMNTGPLKEVNLYFIFDDKEGKDSKTTLTIEIRVKYNFLLKPVISLIVKPKMRQRVSDMTGTIRSLCEKIFRERNTEASEIA